MKMQFGPVLIGRCHVAVFRSGPLGLPIAIAFDANGEIRDAIQVKPLTRDDLRMPRKPLARLMKELSYGDAFTFTDTIAEAMATPDAWHAPVAWTFSPSGVLLATPEVRT